MNGTEMASDVTKLLVVNNAHHFDSEATLCCLGGGDLSRILTSRQEYMEFLHLSVIEQGTDRCRPAGLYEFKDSDGS